MRYTYVDCHRSVIVAVLTFGSIFMASPALTAQFSTINGLTGMPFRLEAESTYTVRNRTSFFYDQADRTTFRGHFHIVGPPGEDPFVDPAQKYSISGSVAAVGDYQIVPVPGRNCCPCAAAHAVDRGNLELIGFYNDRGIVLNSLPIIWKRTDVPPRCYSPGHRAQIPVSWPSRGFITSVPSQFDWRFDQYYRPNPNNVNNQGRTDGGDWINLMPGCAIRMPPATVKVRSSGSVNIPDINNSLSARQMDNLSRRRMEGTVLWGLTQSLIVKPVIDSQRRVHDDAFGEGYCLSVIPETLAINLRAQLTLYLASELRPGTCPYTAVLKHEQRHIRAIGDLVRNYAEQIATALSTSVLPAPGQEWWAASRDSADTELDRHIKTIAQPYADQLVAAIKAKNEELDAVDETRAACPQADWDQVSSRFYRGGHGG